MKRTLKTIAIALLACFSMTMISCNKEYTITVNPNNPEWGTTEGSGVYTAGATVEISATPKPGYYFIKWNDNVTDSVRIITVTGDATYTAFFSNNANGGGTGGEDVENIAGSYRGYNGNDEYTLWLGTAGICMLEIVYNIDTDDEEILSSDYSPYTYANGSGSFDLAGDLSGHGTFTVSGNTLTMSYGGVSVTMDKAQ